MPKIDEIVEFGSFRLHVAGRMLERKGEAVKIGSRSLDLLIALVERPGEVLSRRELMARAWAGLVVDEANLRVNIASLRKCLGEGKEGTRYIVNLPGRGYSFVAPLTRARVEASPGKFETIRSPDPRSGNQPPVSVSEHSLPERLGRLIGRDASVRAVGEMLTKHRFVSIIGPGGMGKTTVAISVAHTMLEAFNGAVYYVDLVSVSDASLVPSAIASVLGLKVQVQDPKPSILAFFGARRALLVLDNCEHLIDEIALLAEWLYTSAPQTHLLATSRELLRVEGEHVHILPALDVPPVIEGMTASTAMSFPAVELFMDRVAASGVQETLTDEMVPLVAEICRKTDGIALAIEWAAGRVRSHGLRGTAELINSRFNLLWQGRRSALPRHKTLQAMLDWSYNLLSESERRVLYRLSVFVGPCQMEAAHWIAADTVLTEAEVTAVIASLSDKSLLSPSILNGSSYLRLLDTTRTYASAKFAESGEVNDVSRKLAEYLIAQFNRNNERQNGRRAMGRDLIQVGNMRTALSWAFSEAGEGELGVRLAALAAPYLLELSLLDECHRWCQAALLRLGARESSTTHLILQEALAISALFTRRNGDEVRIPIEQGLRLARTLNDPERELRLLAGQHIFMCHIGHFREAVEVSQRSIELACRVGFPAGIVMSEWMLGAAYHLVGNQTRALQHIEKGFKQAAVHGTLKVDLLGFGHQIRALTVLARTLWLSGTPDRAAQVAYQAIEEAEQTEQPVSMLIVLLYASPVFLWRGDIEEAEALVSRLNQHFSRYSFGPRAALGLALSGELALLKGELRTAAGRLCDALDNLYAEKLFMFTTTLSRSLSEALFECGDIMEAEAMITAALEQAEARDESFDMPELLRTRAQIGTVSGRLDAKAAEEMLRHSMALANSQGALSLELRSAMALGALLTNEERAEEAYAILAEVYDRFTEGHETRDLRTAKQLIEAWCPAARASGCRTSD
ncbi:MULTISPECIES: ATP-binding protein [unclassified Halomonas]|uniref:ATP-binding protein n=1 Tax=unclassified Halomonas TaxID=2609666 RepID=UPI001CF5E887|nr:MULTISPECIES: winged helix-turn-helix domain-containing protein [unclassified Halomonas]MCA8865116.1 transcriptional regulator [Halomonas sp. SBBP1]UZH12089.1 winged helix-turn-helix domain-containing protein [Halomonas sp. BDJS001]